MRKLFATVCVLFQIHFTFAQNEGDALFNTDQVIQVDFTFTQPAYWDSLVNNYASGTYMWAGMIITDLTGVHQYDSVGVRLKGNSSYNHPNDKKSMKIDINEYVSGQNYHGLKKLNLNNGFKDPTFLREKVFMDFSRDMGVLAPRINFAIVYMNGQLKGFFTVGEQIDDQFLDRWILDDDGNLFSAADNFGMGPGGGGDEADLQWYGADQTDYYNRYELKTNETANDWSDLLNLIDAIDNTTDNDYITQVPALWEWEELNRSLAIDNVFANLDSYINSARNYKIYHNATTGNWEWIKWDANEAFGSYAGGAGNMIQLAPDYVATDRPLLERIHTIPDMQEDFYIQYCQVLDLFTNAHLDPKIDSLVTLIQSSVYADPNKMYTNLEFDQNITTDISGGPGPGGGTTYGLKSFISQRASYLSGVLDCALYTGLEEASTGMNVTLYPNPASDHVQVDLSGLSGDALLLMHNSRGQLVRTVRVIAGQLIDVDIRGLSDGMYSLQVVTDDQLISTRLVVQ
jgi:hypothetical protein